MLLGRANTDIHLDPQTAGAEASDSDLPCAFRPPPFCHDPAAPPISSPSCG